MIVLAEDDATLEAELLDAVSGDRLMQTTADIAQWVRLSGSEEELESFEYVQRTLQGFGYQTRLERHPGFISLPLEASLDVGDGSEVACITHAFATSTAAGGLRAELVYVPDLERATEAVVRGRIALVDGMASGGSTLRLEGLGAIGQIYVHDDYLHETSVSPQWGSPTDRTIAGFPTTPGLSITRGDGAALKARLEAGPVSVTMHARVDTGWRDIPVLTADLPGEWPSFVLLSSHIDSWHYGAMDNGSANATVLEVARLVAAQAGRLRRGLRLAFWSGHSHGRFCGSAWYADHHWHELQERCLAHVYCDSTGGMGATVVSEPPVMPETRQVGAEALAAVTGEELVGKRLGRFADQSFYGVGLPGLFGTFSEQDAERTKGAVSFRTGGSRGGGLGWWWHTPFDTVDKVDPEMLTRDTRVYVAAVWRFLQAVVAPLDLTAAVDEISAGVAALAREAGEGLPLDGPMALLTRLRDELGRFYEDVARRAPDHLDDSAEARAWCERVDRILMRASRHLVAVSSHGANRYEHDEAAPLTPVPSLQAARRLAGLDPGSDARHLLETRLVRTVNWLEDEVRAAIACVEGVPGPS